MAQFRPLFLDTGSIEVVHGNRIVDFMHFPVTASNITTSYNTLLPDPYLFTTTSVNITNAVNTTSSSLFQFRVPGRQEQYLYAHNSIIGVTTSATTTGVRIGIQRSQNADAFSNIKVSSTLTAHTIACVGTEIGTTFALPASMAAINTVYPCFVKGLYTDSRNVSIVNNVILLQPETNNTVTAFSGSVSYNKFSGYNINPFDRMFNLGGIGISLDAPQYDIISQKDDKLVLIGFFTAYNGTAQSFVTRTNADGTRDTSFNIGTGFDSPAIRVEQQNDEKLVFVGNFTLYNGTAQNYVTRLNTNGTVDTSFNIGTGFNNTTLCVAIQNDNNIIVGGAFTTYSGSTQNRITRLNTDGTIDTSFNIGTGANSSIRTLSIQEDGKILVGGDFTTYSGSTQNRITRLNTDGTIDTSFNIGTGFNQSVFSSKIQTDGKILVVGDFTSYSGSAQNRIVRLNIDGTIDTSFTSGITPSLVLTRVQIDQNRKIIVLGDSINIERLNIDGSIDSTFYQYATGFDGFVRNVAFQSNNKTVIFGDFLTINSVNVGGIFRILSTSPEQNKEKNTPLYLLTGSLKQISGSDTVTSSFLPPTASLWLSQSLTASVSNSSATVYATVFSLPGLVTNKTYLANLYIIGNSAAAATGFRMRVVTGSSYRGTLYTPTSTTAPAIQNSANANNITSITAGTWPTLNTKYLVYGEYTFVKGTTDPQVQILSETAATFVTATSGSVIFYRAID
jgi:uncharacterized delta-60 repeat protein